MAKKVIYVENQLVELVNLMERNTAGKRTGDRISIPAMYGADSRLFKQSEINGSIASLSKKGTYLKQLAGEAGTKILFQLVSRVAFDASYSVKEARPVRAAVPAAAVPAAAVPAAAVPAAAVPAAAVPAAAEITAAEKASPIYGTAFEQIRELLPKLTKEERAALARLLKEAEN